MGRLDGKVALISGGARGQGAAEAQLCAREGAKVVFGDLLDAEGRQVEGSIRAAGGEVTDGAPGRHQRGQLAGGGGDRGES